MKSIKRLNGLRIILWIMFGVLTTACVTLTFVNAGNDKIGIYCLAASLILMWIICFCNNFLKKKERQLLAKSVLKLVSSTLKQSGIKKYSLNCEMVETVRDISFEISIETAVLAEICLKCQENVLEYLEPYGNMKKKIVEVNIRQYQSLVIGDFEG